MMEMTVEGKRMITPGFVRAEEFALCIRTRIKTRDVEVMASIALV